MVSEKACYGSQHESAKVAMKMDAIFHGDKRKEKYFDTVMIVSI